MYKTFLDQLLLGIFEPVMGSQIIKFGFSLAFSGSGLISACLQICFMQIKSRDFAFVQV